MAELKDLFMHHGDFAPSVPQRVEDACKCPECGQSTPFSAWKHHNGVDSGFYCDDCNDFHSCFECPGCGELLGAAGSITLPIEVRAIDHEWRGPSGTETTALPDEPKPNHVRDAVRANMN